jgi:hypothetical protein
MDASARQIIRVGTATADRSPGGGRVLEGISATPVAEQRDCLDFAVAETNRRHADLWLVHGCEPEMLGRRATHLGGVARHVLDRSPCPVIVTPRSTLPGAPVRDRRHRRRGRGRSPVSLGASTRVAGHRVEGPIALLLWTLTADIASVWTASGGVAER